MTVQNFHTSPKPTATLLKVSRRRVVAMIGAGILEAEKFGEKVWQVNAESVKKRQEKMKGKKNED